MNLLKFKNEGYFSIVLGILFSLFILPISSYAQVSCGTDEIHEFEMKTNPEYKRKYLQQNEEILSIIQNNENTRVVDGQTVYTIPIVVHVIHLGEPEGVGNNISDFQITEAIRGANERFRNIIGNGADIQLEFCLASRDPNGNITNGINRVDGRSIPLYESGGVKKIGETSCDNIAANELAIKNLSKWPVLDYYNIWVVHKICGGWAGYSYYPNGLYYDGTLILSNYIKYEISTLAHEIGHGFNLTHTFNGDGGNQSCPVNNNCKAQGDFVCDTPPHKQGDCGSSNPCDSTDEWNNSRNNYMSYCSSRTLFTQGQKDRMRATLKVFPRANLLNSLKCYPPAMNSITIKEILNVSGTFCNSRQIQPQIKITNIGNNIVNSLTINYTLNDGIEKSIRWTGIILSGKDASVRLNLLDVSIGSNTLNVRISLPNDKEDDLKYQQTQNINFNLEPSDCFVSIWKSDNSGTSDQKQILVPSFSDSEFNIYWEEISNSSNYGTVKGNNNTTIEFPQKGTFRVSIAPQENGFRQISFNNGGDKSKILEVEQWGKILWSSFQNAFSGCENLVVSASDIPILSDVKDMSQMFSGAISFNQSIGKWNINNVLQMGNMLSNSGLDCQNYNQTLIGWTNNPQTPDSLSLGADGIEYGTEGVEARNLLLSKGWTITDGGLDEDCDLITSNLEHRSKSDLISVYPNPNQGNFTIEIFGENRNVTLEIVNVLGQKVFSKQLKKLNGKQTIQADLSSHGKGVYFINLYYNNEVINRRVIVQ